MMRNRKHEKVDDGSDDDSSEDEEMDLRPNHDGNDDGDTKLRIFML